MIFIGGTGRSGTTILSKILGNHKEIYSFPRELRFITDPDGLISLRSALVSNWSKFHGDFAIERYLTLMKNLKYKYRGKYPNYGHSELVGVDFYNLWLDKLTKDIINFSMKSSWAGRTNLLRKGMIKLLGNKKYTKPVMSRAFYCSPMTDKAFNEYFRGYLMEFFDRAATFNNAKMTVDHTPSNLIHFDKIRNIIPKAKLIHIYRDPRDVVASYKTRDWGSKSAFENTIWIKDVLFRWKGIRSKLKLNSYIEIKFESLIQSPEKELKRLCEFLRIKYDQSFLNINFSRHNIGRWKQDLDEDEKAMIHKCLNDMIVELGYK